MASSHQAATQQAMAGPQPAPASNKSNQNQTIPTKQNLKSWWRNFARVQGKGQETSGTIQFSYVYAMEQRLPNQEVPAESQHPLDVEREQVEAGRSSLASDLSPPLFSSVYAEPERSRTPWASLNSSEIHMEDMYSLGASMPNEALQLPGQTDSTRSISLGDAEDTRLLSPPRRVGRFVEGDLGRDSMSTVLVFERVGSPSGSGGASASRCCTLNLFSLLCIPCRKPPSVALRNLTKGNVNTAEPAGIFGVPLRQSITYANVAISLVDTEGKSYIYGYVPIVVAKCGVFLKEKATNVEGIFRLSGAEKRIKELVVIFNSPDRYGKGLDWDGYTVHDAANVFRRYLNQLPEPIVPLDLYERFREPLRGHAQEAVGDQEASQDSDEFDLAETIAKYQRLITELPPLNRQLLLYILDLLAVFASKSDENRMTSHNLAAIFQPGMLSHPAHDMAPSEYRLSQDVLVFLIEHQDHFLIGMRGTAADDQTVQDVQNGNTPPPATPNTPTQNRGKTTVVRSPSNASAGAESLRRQGGVRRNVSVNSRNSRQSNGAPSPASPAFGSSLAHSPSGGVHRSNTVPSKKSPRPPSGGLQKNQDGLTPTTPVLQAMPGSGGPVYDSVNEPPKRGISPASSPSIQPAAVGASGLAPGSHMATAGHSQDRLLPDPRDRSEIATPTRERALFPRSPTTDSDKRQPNKLRKRRIPGSSNHSAQSSTQSLHGQSAGVSPGISAAPGATDISEHPQLESIPHVESATPIKNTPAADNSHLPRPALLEEAQHASESTLKPQASSNSLRSPEDSTNEHSDLDHIDDPVKIEEQKEKRRRWRLSRRHDTGGGSANTKNIGGPNGGPGTSTTSFHSGRPRKSLSGDAATPAAEPGLMHAYPQVSNESGPGSSSTTKDKEEKKGPIDWLKTKMREAKEEKRERDAEKEKERVAKGGPGDGTRGKSMDVRRSNSDKAETPA